MGGRQASAERPEQGRARALFRAAGDVQLGTKQAGEVCADGSCVVVGELNGQGDLLMLGNQYIEGPIGGAKRRPSGPHMNVVCGSQTGVTD
ncbi:hypothetical protein GCM10023068_28260 [Leifsonia shinshuensis]